MILLDREVEEEPGWFDVALLLLGGGLLLWSWIGGRPGIALIGVAAICLGCVLPIRTGWRHAGQRRDRGRRERLIGQGMLLDVAPPVVADLVRAYDDVFRLAGGSSPWIGGPVVPAAHRALIEVASMLRGRPPRSERERAYIGERARAVAQLRDLLRELPSSTPPAAGPTDPYLIESDTYIDVWRDVDRVAPFNSVARIDAIIDEARIRRGE